MQVEADPATGALSPATSRYTKRLSDLDGMFHDADAWSREILGKSDPVVYEVSEFRNEGGDLLIGMTTMRPGKVGDEFYMTRGHFHARRDRGEVYNTLSGAGLLLLESRDGRAEAVEMRHGASALIPPDWAHRTVNTGSGPLIFSWVCAVDAGHDYAAIRERGMRLRVVERDGQPEVVDTR